MSAWSAYMIVGALITIFGVAVYKFVPDNK